MTGLALGAIAFSGGGGGSSSTLHEQQILPDSRILVVDARSPPMNISLGEEEAKILHSLTGTVHNSSDSGLRTHLIHATIPSQTTRSGNMETLNTKAIPLTSTALAFRVGRVCPFPCSHTSEPTKE